MVTYLLKKSYRLKDYKEIEFNDLWGDHGVFTTMWLFDKPQKILFFDQHISNLIKSTKVFKVYKTDLKFNILKILKKIINPKIKYNHLLRVAINKRTLSVSIRKRIKPKLDFTLNLVNLKRVRPEYKNLKYKQILKHLSKLDNSKNDIGLCVNNKVYETGTSNLVFIKNNKIFFPKNNYYKGITFKFFKNKFKKFYYTDIKINKLSEFDEILLIGSGKGVASVKKIKGHSWSRKSMKYYKLFSSTYLKAIKQCKKY